MQFEENGRRINELRDLLKKVAFAATLFDEDGVSIRFMNQACQSDPRDVPRNVPELPDHLVNHIKTDQQIEQLMSQKSFNGLTPLGTQMRAKIIEGIVARGGRKPYLVVTVTDGQPAGENRNAIFETIKYAHSRFPKGTVNFAFVQVGNDQPAQEFLAELDNDPEVGHLVDVTSSK